VPPAPSDDEYGDPVDLSDDDPESPQAAHLHSTVQYQLNECNLFPLSLAAFAAVQDKVREQTRLEAVDWIVQATLRGRFHCSNLFGAVQCLDGVLVEEHISHHHIRLLSAVCLLLSAKVEEISILCPFPTILLAYDNEFTAAALDQEELHVLKLLKGDFNIPTAYFFLSPLIDMLDLHEAAAIAEFCLLLSLYKRFFIEIPPLLTAAVAIIELSGNAALDRGWRRLCRW
jgi:hypothetical protein